MMTGRYVLVVEGLRVQSLDALIKYSKGFGDRVL